MRKQWRGGRQGQGRGGGARTADPPADVLAPRLPPQNLEAERGVLGAILLDNQVLAAAQEVVTVDDFYRLAHKEIFKAMLALGVKGEAIDTITVSAALEQAGQLHHAGGAAYLAELIVAVASASNVVSHARLVKDKAMARALVGLGTELTVRGYDGQDEAAALLALAETTLSELIGAGAGKKLEGMVSVLKAGVDHIEMLSKRGVLVTGIPTGFPSLDKLTAGWQDTDLVLIAARPGMGKTSLALACAVAAAKAGKRTAVFSLEMGKLQVGLRLLGAEGRIDVHRLRTGRLDQEGWASLSAAAHELEQLPVLIDDSGSLSVAQVRSRCVLEKARQGLDLVIVDYLQLMQGDGEQDSRHLELSEMSKGLKRLAKELRIPVIACSQLNRSLEGRQDKRPILSDLRESGALEEDADVVCCLYRDEVYNDQSADKGMAEVLVRKHRNGPIGEIRLRWLERYATFEDLPGPREGA